MHLVDGGWRLRSWILMSDVCFNHERFKKREVIEKGDRERGQTKEMHSKKEAVAERTILEGRRRKENENRDR